MCVEYPLRFEQNHIFVELNGGLYIVDTGSLYSSTSVLNFFGVNALGINNEGRAPVDRVLQNIPIPCNGLVGLDVFRNKNVLIDLPNGRMVLSNRRQTEDCLVIPLIRGTDYLKISVNIAGINIEMVVDTGAFITYLPERFFEGEQPVGTQRDFYPFCGEFDVDIYRKTIEIGDINLDVNAGILPQNLFNSLSGIIGNGGILSNQIFCQYPIELCFAGNERIMNIVR